MGLPSHQLDRIQSVLNVAARLIYGQGRFDHSTLLLTDRLNWLRLPQRIDFKRCLLVYKASFSFFSYKNQRCMLVLHVLAPAYISDYCINININERCSSLRSTAHSRFMIPQLSKMIRLGEHSFSVNGPNLWN